MNIVISLSFLQSPRSINLGGRNLYLFLALVGAILGAIGFGMGYGVSYYTNSPIELITLWNEELEDQRKEINRLSQKTDARVEYLASELGKLHYEVSKLDTITVKLSTATSINVRDFIREKEDSFPKYASLKITDINTLYESMAGQIESKTQELNYLYSILKQNKITQATVPKGWPIKRGYITSYFGKRIHPFTGKIHRHLGVDIGNGIPDSDIFATAAGIVTRSKYVSGYGNLIEIDHGNGLRTRYAHNQENYVVTGMVVYRGQPIAKVGSTGISTGLHVHYEVVKDFKSINPVPFIYKKN